MKVSVLINNFNYAPYLEDCLNSLRNQSVLADEVIFYDDGSSDDSVNIASKYEFVTVISNPNFGEKPSFNQGNAIYQAFLKSTGDIICLMDSDDFYDVDKIKLIKEEFQKNDEVVLVQHQVYEYAKGKITKIIDCSRDKIDKKLYYRSKWTGYYNPTSSLSFRRSYIENFLPFKKDDWVVWPDVRLTRLAPFYGKIITIKRPLTYYRRHDKNDSSVMNFDYSKSLRNQISHHEYVNKSLLSLGYKTINYKKSLKYFSFKLKTLMPKFLVKFIIEFKNKFKRLK